MTQRLEPEARIGGYELVRRIGVGGMAEVWVARRISERRANKYVAIKVVADQYVGDPRFQRMFRTEVELSALLNHVNIVQVFDEGEDDGRSFLVMEWVDGVNLLKVEAALSFVDDEAWRLKIITYVVAQLLYALHYAHSITLHDGNPLGIVHRDVSPQNVLVSAQGEVKLTDFGVAHYLLEESSGIHIKGKLRYMAPEQLGGRTRDPRVDLYAAGAILHELLDGRRFRYHVEDQRDMYIEVLSGQIPPLSRKVPPELDELRLGLLEPNPARRIPTADAALDRLVRFAGYGDARRELAQLCGGLTGVLRPRIGPGKAEGVPADEPARAVKERSEPPSAPSPAAATAGEPGPSSTLRMVGAGPAGGEAPGVDSTQPWHASDALPPGPTATAARLRAGSEATARVSSARDGAGAGARPRGRAAVPLMVLGGLVAAVAGGGAWWVVVGEPPREPSPRAAGPEVVAEAQQGRAASPSGEERHGDERGDEPLVVGHGGSTGEETTEPAGDGASTGHAEVLGTSETGSSETGSSEAGSSETGSSEASSSQPVAPPPPRPKQALSLVAVDALGTVQVEVRSKDGGFRRRFEFRGREGERIPTGSYWVKWRPKDGSSWRKSERVVLRRGCDLRIVLAPQGMKLVPMGSGCR